MLAVSNIYGYRVCSPLNSATECQRCDSFSFPLYNTSCIAIPGGLFNGMSNTSSALALSVVDNTLSLFVTSATSPVCSSSSMPVFSTSLPKFAYLDQPIDITCTGSNDLSVPLRFAAFSGSALPAAYDLSTVQCTTTVSTPIDSMMPQQCVPISSALMPSCNSSFSAVGAQYGVSMQMTVPTSCPQPCSSESLAIRDTCLITYPCLTAQNRSSCLCQKQLASCLAQTGCYPSSQLITSMNCSAYSNQTTTNNNSNTTSTTANVASQKASLVLFIFVAIACAGGIMWAIRRQAAKAAKQSVLINQSVPSSDAPVSL